MIKIKPETKPPGSASAAPKAGNKKKFEQFDPKGSVVRQVKDDIITGVDYVLSIWQPSVVVDCHMHIESGNCAPLPFLWKQIADKSIGLVEALHLKRETMETLGLAGGFVVNFVTRNPLLGERVQLPGNVKPEYRKNSLLQAVAESRKSTYEIASDFKLLMADAYDNVLLPADLYEGVTPVFFCIAMTMDMEYAHLDGYFGLKVYNVIYKDGDPEKKPTRYWTPLHGRWVKQTRDNTTYYKREDHPLSLVIMDEQSAGEFKKNKPEMKTAGLPGVYYNEKNSPVGMSVEAVPFLLNDSETDRYEQWKTQLAETEFAMLANPLKLLPLFHYDPRRWQVADDKNAKAFEQVGESGLYLGFKMYTAQGYRPYDVDRLPILKEFYARCVTERVPVMNHCTPEGAPTFDRDQYLNFTHPMDRPDFRMKKLEAGGDALKYFNDHFVSPKAWEKVLEEYPTLRLCLAHFGGGTDLGLQWLDEMAKLILSGNYPHLYADISSSMADPKHKEKFKARLKEWYGKEIKKPGSPLRERLLFGTDWYMTLLDGVDYAEYVSATKTFIDSFDNDLWFQMTQVNPYDFYRLDEQIERIARNIVEKRKKEISIKIKKGKEEIEKVLRPLAQEEVDNILDEAAYIRYATQGYIKFKETP
jgi:predicted TIM-barrel fold metal-dependent hydrolase